MQHVRLVLLNLRKWLGELLLMLLLLLPLHEPTPLLCTPDGIELEVGLLAIALKELLGLRVEFLQILDCTVLVFIFQFYVLILFLKILPLLCSSAAFFYLSDLGSKMFDAFICLTNLCLLLGQLACDSLFFGQTRYAFHFKIFCAREERKSRVEAICIVFHDA